LTPRVVFVLPVLNGGGAERAVLQLAAESRLECTVVTERPGGDLADHPLAAGVQCIHAGGGRIARIAALTRALRARRVDIVVSALSPVVVAAAARSQRLPVITWIQNPINCVVRDVPGSRRPQVRNAVARLIAGASSAVAATAPGLRDEWRAAGVADERTCVLPNGTRWPADVIRHEADAHELRLLSVGRLAPQKRHDVAIAALAQLRSSGCPARLEILGRGPAEGSLRALAGRLGLAEHVTFSGFLSDPGPRYLAADVFVLTSDFEGFGNVVVEALAHELPVVATDAPYGPRFILEGLEGTRLVERGNPAAVAQAIGEVVAQRRANPSLAVLARQRARAFAVQRTAEHFEAIVSAILEHGPLPSWISPPSPGA
jgi:glycosyltransferase involved in cell wall biosynthesis